MMAPARPTNRPVCPFPSPRPTLVAALLLGVLLPGASALRAEVYWVDTTSDAHDANPGDGVCASAAGDCTFRAAMEEANAGTNEFPSDVVSLPLGIHKLTLGVVTIEDGVTIRGDGSCRTVIDAQEDSGILVVDASVEEIVNIRYLTLQNGNTDTGGALHVESEDALTQCHEVVFRNNFAYSWGGAIKTRSSLYMTDCTVNNNETYARGGGIDASATAHVELTRTTVSYNKANQGGGIRVLGSMDATNSTFSHNHADFTGGGILNVGTTHLASSTVVLNTVGDVGGGLNNVDGYVWIWNTIVALNEAASTGHDLHGEIHWEARNLVGTGDGATFWNEPFNAMIGDDFSPIDPKIDETLRFNGGLTRNHRLEIGSPAIDGGSTAAPGGGALFACEDEDQRKYVRAIDGDYDGDAVCDLGAYEYHSYEAPSEGDGGPADDVKVTPSGSSSDCVRGYYGGKFEVLGGGNDDFVYELPEPLPDRPGSSDAIRVVTEGDTAEEAEDAEDGDGVMSLGVVMDLDPNVPASRSIATRALRVEPAPLSLVPSPFRRGDVDGNGALGLNDVIGLLVWQFAAGSAPGCLDAADADDDGMIHMGDTFAILDRLFRGTAPLPSPGAERCGVDPTEDSLDCRSAASSCDA